MRQLEKIECFLIRYMAKEEEQQKERNKEGKEEGND